MRHLITIAAVLSILCTLLPVDGQLQRWATTSPSAAEIGYVSGVTSAIQTQLDGKLTPSGTPISGALLMANGTGGLSGTWSQIVVTNGGTNVYLPGSVGIGTSTPNYPGGYFYPGKFLMIRDSFQAGLLLDADSYAEINWISRGNQPNRTTYALGMVPGDGMVSFRSATDTGLLMEYVMSFSTNRVGIGVGTTFPTTRLQVKGDFVNDLGQLHVLGNNYGYIAVDTAQADTNQYTSGIFFKQNGVVNWQYYTKGGDLIWHRTSGGVNEKMRLTQDGSLGIGTTTPNILGSGTFPGRVLKIQDNTQAGIGLETAGGFAEMAWMDTSSATNRKLWALGAAGGEGLLTLRSGTDAGGINNYIVSFGTNSMILNQGHVETGYTLTVGGTSWLNGNTTNSGTVHLSAAHVANKGALYVNGTDSGYIGLNAPASGSSGVLINRSGTNIWLLYTPSGSTDFVFGYTAAGTEKGAVSQAGVIRATSGFRAASVDGITTTWTNVISGVITQRISTIGGIVVTNLTL